MKQNLSFSVKEAFKTIFAFKKHSKLQKPLNSTLVTLLTNPLHRLTKKSIFLRLQPPNSTEKLSKLSRKNVEYFIALLHLFTDNSRSSPRAHSYL